MLLFKTILFPVDFSDRSRGAAHYVKAFAVRFKARVILLNVVENLVVQPVDIDFGPLVPPDYWLNRTEYAKQHLARFAAEALNHIQVEHKVEAGDPALLITQTAQTENADLIMMPTHGYGGFRRFLLGSVTAKVLHDAGCAVWTGVHINEAPSQQMNVRSIVCAVDLNETSRSVLAAAAELAAQFGAKLTATHAVPGPVAFPERLMDKEFRLDLIRETRRQIEATCSSAGVPADICIDSGEVHRVVAACATTHEADLVVIGRGLHSGLGRLRAHGYAIIRESPCPVISI